MLCYGAAVVGADDVHHPTPRPLSPLAALTDRAYFQKAGVRGCCSLHIFFGHNAIRIEPSTGYWTANVFDAGRESEGQLRKERNGDYRRVVILLVDHADLGPGGEVQIVIRPLQAWQLRGKGQHTASMQRATCDATEGSSRGQRALDGQTFIPQEGAAGFLADHDEQLGLRSGQLWRVDGLVRARRTGGIDRLGSRVLKSWKLRLRLAGRRRRWFMARASRAQRRGHSGACCTLDGTTPQPKSSDTSAGHHRLLSMTTTPFPESKMSAAWPFPTSAPRILISSSLSPRPALGTSWQQWAADKA